ncbi:RmuC domain protein [Eubacterium nodatum ATCC 33099]|nr:RmuC domain protein [Eubacterium nodatum ATCC 33099]
MGAIEIILLILLVAVTCVSVFLLSRFTGLYKEMNAYRQETGRAINDSFNSFSNMLYNSQKSTIDSQEKRLDEISRQFNRMQADNNQRLDEMRNIVDEKLQKTLEERIGQSFRTVNHSLSKVAEGLGEMQTIAGGVGDLKKVLSNVKTRGVLGEIQLASILEEILAPQQYEQNVNTTGEGRNIVEFAVKLPGNDEGFVWLPIDSKFPGDTYGNLVDAYETGDSKLVLAAQKELISTIKKEAKDISEKYIAPPKTTNFGIMFLPFEGLYSEVVRLGLVEVLQRDYKVNIAGPTTMAATLNSLQMGFKTLAIQKRTGEVWEILGAVKTEFAKFEAELEKAQKNVIQANNNLENLLGTRSRVMRSKLKKVEELPGDEARKILDLED